MRPKRLDPKGGCPVELTVSVIGGAWKPMILFYLLAEGKKRFMELSRCVPGATQRMLTLQLRELEADGIVIRHVYPEVPPRVEYELTAIGKQLGAVLRSLRDWGVRYRDERPEALAAWRPATAPDDGPGDSTDTVPG
jgi:DNA-binding HxlR family transcriptional regulator